MTSRGGKRNGGEKRSLPSHSLQSESKENASQKGRREGNCVAVASLGLTGLSLAKLQPRLFCFQGTLTQPAGRL